MSRTLNRLMVALLVLAAAGCAKKVDVEKARAALRATDMEWSSAANNADSFASYFATAGTLLPPSEPAVTGTGNIREWASRMMSTPGFSVNWRVSAADVAKSGELGYTSGTYTLHMQNPDGAAIDDHGKYLTVWTRDKDGKWKVTFDTFNSDLPPATPATESEHKGNMAPEDSSWVNDK
ncbi:MAG TPA: DUF4440 domain-containing protein [Candidatus Krumholzibacteria bacterium]|nr:DUF4440 domain-containing protein [Candidatus Krumholzibacteria bacterium]